MRVAILQGVSNDQILSKGGIYYISYISLRKIITQERGALFSAILIMCCRLYISLQYII